MSESADNKNWVQVPFGAVATLINGRAYKQPEMLSAGTPILRIQNLNGGSNWYYSDLDLPDDKYCNPGDLLYAWSASFGPYRYNGPKAIFHYHIWNVVPDAGIDKAFVYYQLLRITDALRQSAHGVAMPHITKAGMEAWEIGLPPFSEQKRIADKLDTVLTRVDACRDRLARVAPLLKRFRQSVLAAATSGRLTADWRDLSCESLWIDCCVGDFTLSSYYGPRFGATEYTLEDSGIPTIRTTDMTAKGLIEITQATPRVLVKPEKINDYVVRRGDLLVTRTGSIGVMAIFDGEYLAIPSAYLIRFRFRDIIIPKYAYMLLSAPAGQDAMGLSTTTTTQPNINAEAIKRIKVNLPPKEEQAEIIRRVETLFAFADRLEARLIAAQTATDRLTPALLAKAFRGELVPQDPNDEPAAELLKRLAASRDAAPKAKRGRRSATVDTTS